jgi:hypothetical protein
MSMVGIAMGINANHGHGLTARRKKPTSFFFFFSSNAKQPFICCRVVVLKWLANLTHVPQSTHHHDVNFATCAAVLPQHIGSPAMESSFYSQISEREAPTYIRYRFHFTIAVLILRMLDE